MSRVTHCTVCLSLGLGVAALAAAKAGDPIGSYRIDAERQVVAYSNGEHTGTGYGPLKYQCVDLVRRYLAAVDPSYTFRAIGEAKNFFPLVQEGKVPYLRAIRNGDEAPPQRGDILCCGNHASGHIAVIGWVQIEGPEQYIVLVEQNWSRETAYGRIPLTVEGGRFTVGANGKRGNYTVQGWCRLSSGSRGTWRYTHPAHYTGPVWIRIAPTPENRRQAHDLRLRWGPWEYRRRLSFEGGRAIVLNHRKTDRLAVPMTMWVSPECTVSFGQGRGRWENTLELDSNEGWTKVE